MRTLFTIGYATKPVATFLAQIQHYGVNAVADIRSVPYSKVFTDFHRENIQNYLSKHEIAYVYLGEELGPRSKDDSHYNEYGQVQFPRLMQSALFKQGIDRIRQGLGKNFTIALMCAEKDAATCHRSLLVGYYLLRHPIVLNGADPVDVLHIDHEGDTETQSALEERVMSLHDNGTDLFMSYEQRMRQAYEIQLRKTSYIKV